MADGLGESLINKSSCKLSFPDSCVLFPANRRHPRNQLAKEILENLDKFPHCILLTRVGQFYEVRFIDHIIGNRCNVLSLVIL